MTFDFIIGNPPYEGRNYLYIKILYSAYNQSNAISWLCPTTFVDDVYKRNDTFNKAINTFKKNLANFEDVDPSGFDMLVAQNSLGIFHMQKGYKANIDMAELAWRKYESPEKLKSICAKIQRYCKNKSLLKSIVSLKIVDGTKAIPNPKLKIYPNKWYIGTAWVRGTVNDWSWVTLFSRQDLPLKGSVRDTWFHAWVFDTEKQANDFHKYINSSDILKFSIYMEKKNQTNNRSDYGYFPDTDLPWNEKELQDKIGLSSNDMSLLKKELNNFLKS